MGKLCLYSSCDLLKILQLPLRVSCVDEHNFTVPFFTHDFLNYSNGDPTKAYQIPLPIVPTNRHCIQYEGQFIRGEVYERSASECRPDDGSSGECGIVFRVRAANNCPPRHRLPGAVGVHGDRAPPGLDWHNRRARDPTAFR